MKPIVKTAMTRSVGLAVLTALCSPVYAQEDEWVPVSGADYLRDLIGGLTAEFEYEPGKSAKGRYFEDGTAEIELLGGRLRRKWWIEGDDNVCYASLINRERSCYRIEQSTKHLDRLRATRDDGTVFVARVVDEDTKALIRESGTVAPGSISTPSASEVAAELSNPNSTLGSMSLYFDYLGMQGDLEGADSASATKITFQPSMPYPISKTANFFFRPLFPLIVQQEVPDGDGVENKTFELGDIGYDLAVFNSWRNGLIFGGGMAGAIPSATDNALGADRWTLGPEVILAVMKPWGVLGLIASHQWDVGGGGDDEIEVTGGQYIYSFNIKDGWVIAAGPTFSYNHKADDGNKLTLPLGIGASKTAFLGGRAWKFGLQYWYYVESPDLFGPRHQLRLQVTPVVKLPW